MTQRKNMFSIELHEYNEERPNGDRATSLSNSRRYTVVLINNVLKSSMIVNTFDSYDRFHGAIGDWQAKKHQAKQLAELLVANLQCEDYIFRTFNEDKEITIRWKEVK